MVAENPRWPWGSVVKTVLAVFFATVTLAVLLPAPPPVRHEPERKPVYFWHMWSGEWQPVVESICRRFNQYQTEYEVIPLQIPPDGAATKFLLSAAGGSCPDLVSQWNPVLGMWTDRGLIRPIEDVMTPEEKRRFLAEAYPIQRKHAVYRGKIMALIAGVDVSAVYYRLDHLKEVGVDQRHLPTTLEGLLALGRKLDRIDKNGRLRRVGFLPQYFPAYAPSFGGSFNGPKGLLLDTPEQRRALHLIADTMQALGHDTVTRFTSSQAADTGVTQPLIAGNYSMLLDGQWRVKQTKQYAPDLPYCIAPLPPPAGGKPMASNTSANYMVIPTAARNPKGALAFLKFWIGMDDAEAGGRNVADMGWLPYCRRVTESKSYQHYLSQYPPFKVFVELAASPNLDIPPQGPLQSFVMNEITKADDSATRGTLTPEAALRQMAENVRKEAERQRRLGHEP